ncbi:DUF6795 domain-containing protein [Algicola sagamiensis]|uniref:DUF6795 domain-containing protein n=1 Tax=Algicola sagamiensis TaxID=163869 RepID=UPI00035FDB28|nr:DUF6795 domain-containing protein [Algicola sagamiensis]
MTLHGKPIPQLEVQRCLIYPEPEDEIIDTVITNDNGEFHFEPKSMKSRLPGNIFHEVAIAQIIDLTYEEERYVLWSASQRQIDTPPEIRDCLLSLNGDLSSPKEQYDFEKDEVSALSIGTISICRW